MFEEPAYQWRDPGWRQAAETWIGQATERFDNPISGPVAGVRFLPWSAVLRAPTRRGDVYFKACGPSQAFEPALAAWLAAMFPDCMVPVLARNDERGWYIMPDGGPTLTHAVQTSNDEVGHWRRVLTQQTGLQRRLTERAGEMLSIGVPDRRPVVLPELYASLLEHPERLLVGEPGALTTADVARLRAFVPRVSAICDELAATGPGDTFIHDDFHEDHIFASRRPNGSWRYVFFDFGDACVGHPFMQLISQPRFASNRFGIEADPIQSMLREIYLAHWRDFGAPDALSRALSLALIAGCVIRAVTWINACGAHLEELSTELRDAYSMRVAFWMLQIATRVERLNRISNA